MKSLQRWMILFMAIFVVACQSQTFETPVSVIEIPLEEPFVEPTGTPDCQPDPEVILQVQQSGPRSVSLRASGLQPGEIPRVIYSASAQGFGAFGEAGEFVQGADEQGEFSFELNGLLLGYGSPNAPASATWDIRLIHARGVACATITLP